MDITLSKPTCKLHVHVDEVRVNSQKYQLRTEDYKSTSKQDTGMSIINS